MRGRDANARIIERLLGAYPGAGVRLDYGTPLQLLTATILSAQCTDRKVNEITPLLWHEFPTAQALADAPADRLESILRPTGFFRQKTQCLQRVCREINERYGGRVPDTIEQLTALPGVGRKTANVVLANIYGQPMIPVDTHVKRVSVRLGLAHGSDPDRIEQQLYDVIPRSQRRAAAFAIGEHGREVCASRRPDCAHCIVSDLCPSVRTEVS